jgi:peptidyl-prolyl isomerase H (cyclophilin H)
MSTVVFLDFALFDEPLGRVKVVLETGLAPRASENFRQLCTGEYRVDRVPVGYKGCVVRLRLSTTNGKPGILLESGDFDGRGGVSIYGEGIVIDSLAALKADQPGTVCMLPEGRGSKFVIIPGVIGDLQYQVVGRVVMEGWPVLNKLQAILTDKTVPADSVTICQCGQMY